MSVDCWADLYESRSTLFFKVLAKYYTPHYYLDGRHILQQFEDFLACHHYKNNTEGNLF